MVAQQVLVLFVLVRIRVGLQAMKKIFVSIPYTDHQAEFPERCAMAHKRYDAKDTVVFTPKDVVRDSATPYACCMGKTIEKILECDEVIFADGWADSRGCRLEYYACVNYDIPHFVDVKI